MNRNIPELLRHYRTEAGLTQQQIADCIHVSRNTYTQYENGTRRIDVDTFLAIIEALNIEISLRDWTDIQKKLTDVTHAKKEWENMREDFFKAIYETNLMKLKEYLEAGMDVEIRTEENTRAFIVALHWGQGEIVKLLLDYGAEYVTEWDYQWHDDWDRPLTIAAEQGYYSVVKALLEWGREVDDDIEYGPTPIEAACLGERYNVVRLLMKHGADINKHWYNGKIVKQLIERKKDNMLLYIKENYYVQLDDIQRKLLNEYFEKNKVIDTRKKENYYEWAWEFYNHREVIQACDEIESKVTDEFRKKEYKDIRVNLKNWTKEYLNQKGTNRLLIALAFFSFRLEEPVIYEELKTYVVKNLKARIAKCPGLKETQGEFLKRVEVLPTYT